MVEYCRKKLEEKILLWTQNKKLIKVCFSYQRKRVVFFGDNDEVLLIRAGLTIAQMNDIEDMIKRIKFKRKETAYFFGVS